MELYLVGGGSDLFIDSQEYSPFNLSILDMFSTGQG